MHLHSERDERTHHCEAACFLDVAVVLFVSFDASKYSTIAFFSSYRLVFICLLPARRIRGFEN